MSAIQKLPDIETVLLLATAQRPNEAAIEDIRKAVTRIGNWDHFLERAFETNLAPLLYKSLREIKNTGIPGFVLQALKDYRRKIVFHTMQLYTGLEKIGLLLNAAEIEFIPLKGMMLAEVIYKDISLRQISDIDLLVKRSQVERCKELLVAAGWSCEESVKLKETDSNLFDHAHPYKFTNGVAVIELHQHIHSGWSGYFVEINDYWKRSTSMPFLKGSASFLSPADLLQHLCLHLYQHLQSREIKISSFYDIKLVIDHYRNTIDWIELRDTCLNYGCLQQVQTVLYIAKAYWYADVPAVIFESIAATVYEQAERLFLERLGDPYRKKADSINSIITIKQISSAKGIWNKFIILIGALFPSRKFMVKRYCAKQPSLVYFYYIRRINTAVWQLFLFSWTKIKDRLQGA